jgi:integrase
MALIKRGNIFHVRKMVGTVLIARSTKTSNKRIAEQLEAKWVSEVHAEVVVAGRKPITVQKAIALFLESRRGQAGHQSAQIKLMMFAQFNHMMLHEVDPNEIATICRDMVEDEDYKVSTVNVSISYWNAVHNHCTQTGFTPGKKVKKLKGSTGKLRFLNDVEIAALLAELNPNNGHFREKRKAQDNLDFVMLLLHTGARDREVATLSLSQIDHTAGTLTIHRSKGGTDTTLRMTKAMTEVIARRMVAAEQPLPEGQSQHGRTGDGFVFPERAPARYNNEWFNAACIRAKVKDVTLHTLRHTFATRMLRGGVSLHEVQHLLGHRNIASTMVYAHLVPNLTADRAAAILDA